MKNRTCSLLFSNGVIWDNAENFRSMNDCEYSCYYLGEYCEILKDDVLEITWEKQPDEFFSVKAAHPIFQR